jgi:hypothetical protein
MLGLSSSFASDIQISAFFRPPQILLGESTQYVVEIFGNISKIPYQPPQIDGLQFSSSQDIHSMQSINGRQSTQLIRTFRVQASHTGSFTVPSQPISIQGQNYEIPATTLQVLENEEAQEYYNNHKSSESSTVKLSVILPLEKPFYIGQVVPIKIELRVPTSHSCSLLQPYPVLLEKTWINGPFFKPYKVASSRIHDNDVIYCWDTTISAIKSGELSLQYALEVAIEEPMDTGWFSFFSNDRKEQLLSQKSSIQVLSLPLPQPSSFCGGIGDFAITKIHISDGQTLLEEPLTLKIELEGEGNWERMSPPELLYNPDEWRIYPPKCDFRPSDPLQYGGAKTFDYVIIPLKTGTLSAPSVTMSYFDPQRETYQTLQHALKEPVLVSRTQQVASPATSTEKVTKFSSQNQNDHKNSDKNIPQDHFFYLHDTTHFKNLTPLYLRKSFWVWQLLPLAFYLLWILWRLAMWRKSRIFPREDPKRHRRYLSQCLQRTQKAIDEKQIDVASSALQETLHAFLSYCKILDSQSMTYGEIQQACAEKFQRPEDIKIIHQICQHLELQHFSSSSISLDIFQKDFLQLQELFRRHSSQTPKVL